MIRTNFQVLQKLIKAEKLQTVSHLAASMSIKFKIHLLQSGDLFNCYLKILQPIQGRLCRYCLIRIDRAAEVINDYLTFAKPVLEKEEKSNTNEEIQHAVDIITPLATMNKIQLKGVFTEKQHFTKGEGKKFQQCLINLLKNGIESMKPNGELYIFQNLFERYNRNSYSRSRKRHDRRTN